jgi:hypothetical protein
VPADDLAAYIACLRARLKTGELEGLHLTLRDGSVIEDAQAAIQLMLEDVDEYRAVPRAERGQEPWRSLRRALAREFLRLRDVLP